MSSRLTPRAASDQARAEVRRRLHQARLGAGLTLRQLAGLMAENQHAVGFPHLARVESGERNPTSELLHAWAVATGQRDPSGWTQELIRILGQDGLGKHRRVVPMAFRLPEPGPPPPLLTGGGLPPRISSSDGLYARVCGLLANAPDPVTFGLGRSGQPSIILTTRGPLGRALRELGQSVIPIVPASHAVVELILAQTGDERVRAVENALAAGAHASCGYEPIATIEEADYDVVAVPGVGSALILSLSSEEYLWLELPDSIYPDLRDHLQPELEAARSKPFIEFVGSGPQVSPYWFGGWEATLLSHERKAVERLMVQRHLGLLTMPLPSSISEGIREVRSRHIAASDAEAWIRARTERIAVFSRKLRTGSCQYRDIASREAVLRMAEDGYADVSGVSFPTSDDPTERSQRLGDAKARLEYVKGLVASEVGYDLRLIADKDMPVNRHWSLVQKQDLDPRSMIDVLLTFTLGSQPSNAIEQPSFVNAVVYDQEVSKLFREEFEALWNDAPAQDSTIQILNAAISRLDEVAAGI
jgi:hypothetical protein